MNANGSETSRETARQLGLKRYRTEGPCPNGHQRPERFVINGCCIRCSGDRAREWNRSNPHVQKRWREAHPELMRRYIRKSKGQPEPTRPYPTACELCGRPPTAKSKLHLDHDHVSGKFRGWLCVHCNTALGKIGDSYEALLSWSEKAARYLRQETI